MAKLHFYYAAMNAGKSTILLQSSYNYQERGMQTILFTPLIDDRAGIGRIASRIGIEKNAIPIGSDFDLFAYVQTLKHTPNNRLSCVLIDEAQFLTKAQVMQCTDIVDNLKLPVLAYGLRSDFQGEVFEGSKYLLAWAEEISEIKTICHCGRKALMNMRIDEQGNCVRNGEQIEIGGNDRYVAVCRRHFKTGVSARSEETRDIPLFSELEG